MDHPEYSRKKRDYRAIPYWTRLIVFNTCAFCNDYLLLAHTGVAVGAIGIALLVLARLSGIDVLMYGLALVGVSVALMIASALAKMRVDRADPPAL